MTLTARNATRTFANGAGVFDIDLELAEIGRHPAHAPAGAGDQRDLALETTHGCSPCGRPAAEGRRTWPV